MKHLHQFLVLLCSLALTHALGAEMSLSSLPKQNPADPKAAVPQINYVSPFQNYQSFGEIKIVPWKAANDLTQQIGGWRAYLKEANQPEAAEPAAEMQKPTAPQAPAPTPKAPQPDPHSGHKH
ncbi:MAG: multi-Cu oxidase [Pseudomonadota bacterium]|jgi:hypothetical protein